jgi:hypothetical protein
MIDVSKYNKGLPSNFELVGGKIVLTGGPEKVDDNITFWISFIGWFRIFRPQFVLNVYQFYQNTTSYLYQFKNNFRLSVLDSAPDNVPNAEFTAVDLSQEPADRRQLGILLRFTYKFDLRKEPKTLKILADIV